MQYSNHIAGIALRAPRRALRKQHLAMACCLALSFPMLAQAQQAAQAASSDQTVETLDTVKVTGIRAAIATAVETKSESTSIVEAISAEDIGKLPDISIADSISRLPGLTMQRLDGRGQVIHIRGMSEQFAGTLLNGREQVTTGDNRGVELDQYPAELINGVTVYKTPDASLIGQGISGTVDLQSIRPLSFGEQRIVFTGQGELNSFDELTEGGNNKGYRVSASYVDQFADDTVGFAIGVARMDAPFQEKHYKSWWWANTDMWGAPQPGKPADAIALQGAEAWVKSRDTTRDGVMAVLEFKPNERWHSVLDVYASRFDQEEWMRGAMWSNDPWFNGGAVSYSNVSTTNYHGTPVVTGGTLNGIQPAIRNDNNTRESRLFSAGWNNEFKINDTWTLTSDLSYSRAKVEDSKLETYAGRLGGVSADFRVRLSPGYGYYALPDMADPSAVYLRDPQSWGHDGRLEDSHQKDEMKAFRVAVNHVIESSDFLRSWDAGFHVSKRTKEKSAEVYFADLPGRTPTLIDPSLLSSPTDLGFAGMGRVITYDPRALLSRYYDVYISESNDDLQKDAITDEDVKTFYFKANLDMDLTDTVRLRGNAGVQYIRTEQTSEGVVIQQNEDGQALVAGTAGASYGDILPSLNLVADFGNGWNLRFGAAREMMRARINDMGARASVYVQTSQGGPSEWRGSGGNPALEPYRANAYDLSIEKYFGEASYVALAAFYKDMDSYIYTREIPWDFSGYDYEGDEPPASNIGVFSTPANGTGGYMRGYEFSTALGGELIHDALDGFGLLLNASYTESSIDPDGPGIGSGTDTFPGLSKIVANATVYYEKHGFSARVSQRFRDPYRGEYGSIFNQRTYRYTLNERTIDLQLGYDFPESSRLSGLSILFQVNNVNNEPFRTEVSSGTHPDLFFPEEYTEYGRQYLLGFRYKL
ncbi:MULTISPECIES: TonB-dependent receptor [unclassified Pseudoxanthomonas]|uniref:TonB-dependent receptor n=1 Tax=unclassified Pseudoxanthomonas TaxID=2645906 RepID=UPI0008F3A03C|nr:MULTISPECIES: TonB-dependent receptor [unclassified Pseudoxanthomonas]PPJ43533.1 TonB-dependent receptor [Pseudoxanthomonas sp. KAs_5_3]SFV35605.1 iron complex outermembrane recepter protein [Pseudoxanthomonas sp. YR558]